MSEHLTDAEFIDVMAGMAEQRRRGPNEKLLSACRAARDLLTEIRFVPGESYNACPSCGARNDKICDEMEGKADDNNPLLCCIQDHYNWCDLSAVLAQLDAALKECE